MKRMVGIASGLVVGLIAVVVIRTIVYPWRQQVEAGTFSRIDIDADTIAKRLSEAVRFRQFPTMNLPRTISANSLAPFRGSRKTRLQSRSMAPLQACLRRSDPTCQSANERQSQTSGCLAGISMRLFRIRLR